MNALTQCGLFVTCSVIIVGIVIIIPYFCSLVTTLESNLDYLSDRGREIVYETQRVNNRLDSIINDLHEIKNSNINKNEPKKIKTKR